MECQVPSNASHGWRSIIVGREILRKGLGWVIGSGDKVRIWKDPWLSCAKPTTPIGPPNQQDENMLVSDLLCPISNTWDTARIKFVIPQYEDHILQLITSFAPASDRLVWLPEKNGIYSTKTGYGLGVQNLAKLPSELVSFNWTKCIWNVKTNPKIKDFLWKVVRKAIPVSANLETRGLPAFPCAHCGGREDDLHLFLHCKQVWGLAPLFIQPTTTLASMAEFLTKAPLLTGLSPTGLSTPLWPWIL